MPGQPTEHGAGKEPVTTVTSDQAKAVREASPARSARSVSNIPQFSRSRKNSQEFSPTRSNSSGGVLSTVPSAAAVQRALSAQRPLVHPTSVDGVLEGARPERTPRSGNNSPAWPTSPRLKSPPPSVIANRTSMNKKNEGDQLQPNTPLKKLVTVSAPETGAAMQISDVPEQTTYSGLRIPPRGPSGQNGGLETVAESSLPTTPTNGPVATSSVDPKIDSAPLEQRTETTGNTPAHKDADTSAEMSSKKTTDKSESNPSSKPAATTRPPPTLTKRPSAGFIATKPKASDSARTMTVETEPVSSMPPLLVGDRGASGRDGGSVRTKPSTETIRPKKEKKKVARKAPSSGAATSKADIFEAKVASAVDEADSSDSDETFVYESNPPDARPIRHHSRTPSATSQGSQEHYGTRGKQGYRNNSQALGGKKSMKFSSGAYSNNYDGEGSNDGRNSARNSSTPRHHHIGRHGRAAHGSLFDNDSPFTQASKSNSPRTSANNLAKTSRPNSPRLQNGRLPPNSRKADGAGFDAYEDAVADDERAPLLGSVRINRNRHSRRGNELDIRNLEYGEVNDRVQFGGYGNCLFLGFVVTLICVGIATFVVALNQPLQEVSIKHLQNILASEQEIMLDLHVDALNTNLFAITVNDLDINLFAESSYAGTADDWRKSHGRLRWAERGKPSHVETPKLSFPWPPFGSGGGVDEGTDPIEEPEPGIPKLLLGQVLAFDAPLVFEAAPIRRTLSSSVGEIRLSKPGNETEEGGSARWERVVQHPFDLIVRGVLKYQLPLSSKVRSAKIAGRARVNSGDHDGSKPELRVRAGS